MGFNQPGTQIAVDGHLFTGHRIQRETCRHLGYTLGAFGDHQKIHHRENQEDDQPDGQISAHYVVTEGFHDMTTVLLEQDLTCRGNGDRQPKHSGQQQDGRKR